MPDLLEVSPQDTFGYNLLSQGDYEADQDEQSLESETPPIPETTTPNIQSKVKGITPPAWKDVQALPDYQKGTERQRQNAFNTWIGMMHNYGEANDYKPTQGEQETINGWGAKQARDLGMASFIDPINGIVQPINTGQIQDALVRLGKSVGVAAGNAIQGLGHASQYIIPAKSRLDIVEGVEKEGEFLRNKAETIPSNPLYNDTISTKTSDFIGSLLPAVASGGVGPIVGAAQMAQQFKNDAATEGLSDTRQEVAFGVGGAVGYAAQKFAQIIPFLKEADSATALKQIFSQSTGKILLQTLAKNSARGAAEGLGQSMSEQTALGHDLTSNESIKQDLDLAITNGLGGGILGTGFKGMGLREAKGVINAQWESHNEDLKAVGLEPLSYPDYVAARLKQGVKDNSPTESPEQQTTISEAPSPTISPLEDLNASLEKEVIMPPEGETQASSQADTMEATHPVFGDGDYKPQDLLGEMKTSDISPGTQQLLWNDLPTDRVRRRTTNEKGEQEWQYDLATPDEAQNEHFQRPQLIRENLGHQEALQQIKAAIDTAQAVGPATTEEVKANGEINQTVPGETEHSESQPVLDETELGRLPSGDQGERRSSSTELPGGQDDQTRIPSSQQNGEGNAARTHETHAPGNVIEGGGAKNPTPPPTNLDETKTENQQSPQAEPQPSSESKEATGVAEEPKTKGVAPATYLGEQTVPGKPSIPLYNLTEDIDGHSKGSTVSEATLRKAGYNLPEKQEVPLDRENFKEDHGIYIDPETNNLPEDHKKAVDDVASNLRKEGIKGIRLKISNAFRGMFVRAGVDPDTIQVNPESIASVKKPGWIKAASLEEYWHGLQGKAIKLLGEHFAPTYFKIFKEMSPESVTTTITEYVGFKHLIGVEKDKIGWEDQLKIAGEYSRILQQRNGGETTVEDINKTVGKPSEQTKGLLSRDSEFLNSAPTLVRLLDKSVELDSLTRPDKYIDTNAKRPFSNSSNSNSRDNSGTSGGSQAHQLGQSEQVQGREQNAGSADTQDQTSFHVEGPPEELPERSRDLWSAMKGLASSLRSDISKVKKFDDWAKSKNTFSADLSKNVQEVGRVIKFVKNAVPDPIKREALSNYIEAKGDVSVLQERANLTKDKTLKAGYEAALNLTDQEKIIAAHVQKTFDLYQQLATKWGIDVAKVENYVPHVWAEGLEDKLKTAAGRSLRTSFKHANQRSFETYFTGEQLGFKPVTKDISSLLGSYVNDLNYAVASRKFIKGLTEGKAADGSPLVAFKFGSMNHLPTEGEKNQTVLIERGRIADKLYSDYRDDKLPGPLQGWTFKGTLDGKTVFGKDSLAVHPEIYNQLKNIFDRSFLKDWWDAPSESSAGRFGKSLVKGAFALNTKGKTTLFGVVPSLFHPVQIMNEALSHRTVPLDGESYIREPDLSDPQIKDKADHGLMLGPNQASKQLFMDGMDQANQNLIFDAAKLLDKVPGGSELKKQTIDRLNQGTEAVQKWIFETYIPSLKNRFYDIVLERNQQRFSKQLESGEVTQDDLKYLTARTANNAFGHLNYIDIARNPTMQHMMQFAFLAPDFFEARLRHTGQAMQGLLGGKGGWEQSTALAAMGTAMFITARLINGWLNNGDTKMDYPFSIVSGNKAYTMRTQVGDLHKLIGVPWQNGHFAWAGMFQNWRSWISGRESPMTRFAGEALFGVNYRGEATTTADAIKDTLAGNFPISLQPLVRPITKDLPESWQEFLLPKTVRDNPISPFEQFLQSAGIQVSRYSPITRVYQLASQWKNEHGEAFDIPQTKGAYPTSQYTPLRYALEDGDYSKAAQIYQQLVDEKKNAMKVNQGFREALNHSFTGGDRKAERAFVDSLNEQDKQVYESALDRRQLLLQRLSQMRDQMPRK